MGRVASLRSSEFLDAVRILLDADDVLVLDRAGSPGMLRVVARSGAELVPAELPVPGESILARVLSRVVAGARLLRLPGLDGHGPAIVVPVAGPDLCDGVLVATRRPHGRRFTRDELDRARRIAVGDDDPYVAPVDDAPTLTRMFETAAGGISLVDHDLRYRWVNVQLCVMLGRARDALLGLDVAETVHPDHRDRAAAFYDRLLGGEVAGVRERILFRRPDGSPVWSEVGGSVASGASLFLVQQFDITAEQGLAEEHAHRAMHDDLTGLANRVLLRDRLRGLLARAERGGTRTVVLYLDLDRFKDVNDTYGHTAGDAVLRETARRLDAVVRAGDTVARVGGDEFVVAGEASGPDEATQIVERIAVALRPSIDVGPARLSVSASIGVALDNPGDSPDDVVDRADRGLLRAKRFVPLHVVRSRAT